MWFGKRLLGAVLALALGAGCSPDPKPSVGSESHFLRACAAPADCGGGLDCVCGVCTAACDEPASCVALAASAQCLPTARAAPAACGDTVVQSICDVPCTAAGDCAAQGGGYFCRNGFCRVDGLARPAEPLPGFGALCEQAAVSCSVAETPPALGGDYAAQGEVVLSSNALWDVGASEAVALQITEQAGGLVAGNVSLAAFQLAVSGAVIRGAAGAFTVYGQNFVDVQGCGAEVRAVLSGVLDGAATPPAISGGMALLFTGNFTDAGCTAEQLAAYPETGANFEYAGTRVEP